MPNIAWNCKYTGNKYLMLKVKCLLCFWHFDFTIPKIMVMQGVMIMMIMTTIIMIIMMLIFISMGPYDYKIKILGQSAK